jgi:hypothetical protein
MTLLLAVALLGSACKSKEQGAREEFSETYTCPLDRVEVRARPDVKKSDLAKREDPPPNIEADPGRLQLWQSKRDEQRKRDDDGCEMFEARGCGKQTLLCCSRPAKRQDRVNCFQHDYANGVTRW